jgi:hypothetical protein
VCRRRFDEMYYCKEVELVSNKRPGWAGLAVMVASTAFGIWLLGTTPSLADDCGLYCKARQVRIICHDAVKLKGFRGPARDVEFEKCKADATTYKQLQEVKGDTNSLLD